MHRKLCISAQFSVHADAWSKLIGADHTLKNKFESVALCING